MATFTFNADSAEVTGTSGVTKVGTTYQMTGTSAQIDILADAGAGMAFDHSTALESATGAIVDLYSGVKAAYSLRKVSDGYAGSAVEVRRSSDNAVADIGFDSSGELDTAALLAHVGANDGFVSKWYDQSGNAHNATKAVNAEQPQIVSSGSVILDGTKPAVQFVSANSHRLNIADSAQLRPPTLSVFAVFNSTKGSRSDIFSNGSASSFATNNYILATNTPTAAAVLPRTPAGVLSGAITGGQSIYALIADNATTRLNLYVNGSSVITNNFATIGTDNTTGGFIGGSSVLFSDSKIQEIIMFDEDKSADRSKIESNLTEFYISGGSNFAIDYDYTDDAGATNYVNAGNIASLQVVTNTGFQNEKFRLNLTGAIGDTWNSFVIDNYNADVTPPNDPTGARAVDAEVWGMWWVQSPEGSTIKAHLRRVIDGATTYLANVGGVPTWQVAEPTTEWWTFARDNTGADTPFNAFETDDVVGTTITYYVRFVDPSDNASAWVAFTEQSGGFVPGTPTITSITPGNAQLTVAVTADDETLPIFALYKQTNKSAVWSAENASFKRTGSGNITITGLTNGIEYDIITYHKDAEESVPGTPSNIYSGYPDDDAEGTYRHARKVYIRDEMARAALQFAKRQGQRMTYKNEGTGTTGVTVYGVVVDAAARNVGINQGNMDGQEIAVTIPRQTNFPPDNLDLNSTIVVDGEEYQVQRYSMNPSTKTYAHEFIFECYSVRGQQGY